MTERHSGHARTLGGPGPLVIGHRGASGYRPEHTLAAYELAARMGADYLEPDLVATRDHVLVARHEGNIAGTTDVSERPEFADRRTTKVIDGREVTGWFTEDFTLAELKTLRATERLPDLRPQNTLHDGLFDVPTLAEVLALRVRLSRELGRTIGVYPETKNPSYFASIGLPLEEPLVAAMREHGLDSEQAPAFIQSFELGNLVALRTEHRIATPLVLLAAGGRAPYDLLARGDIRTYADLLTPESLLGLAGVVTGIGPSRDLVIPRDADGALAAPTSLVEDAHAAGLQVHAWTFRAENAFLPSEHRSGPVPAEHGRLVDELTAYFDAGIDGFFTDHADLGVRARAAYAGSERAGEPAA